MGVFLHWFTGDLHRRGQRAAAAADQSLRALVTDLLERHLAEVEQAAAEAAAADAAAAEDGAGNVVAAATIPIPALVAVETGPVANAHSNDGGPKQASQQSMAVLTSEQATSATPLPSLAALATPVSAGVNWAMISAVGAIAAAAISVVVFFAQPLWNSFMAQWERAANEGARLEDGPVKIFDRWVAAPAVESCDSEGRLARFQIAYLSTADGRYPGAYWVEKSASEIQLGRQRLSISEFMTQLVPEIGAPHESALEIVAIGVAAEDGPSAAEEHARAIERAQSLANWFAVHDVSQRPVSWLSLGQHRETCEHCEARDLYMQRPIAVAFVLERASGVNVMQAIENSMRDDRGCVGLSVNSSAPPILDQYRDFIHGRSR